MTKKLVLCAIALLFVAMTTIPQNNANEIVFSDTGASMTLTGNSKASSTPFGFWIWCAGAAPAGSNGGYQNANACQGQMYFYALQTKATHVIGFATENPSNSGIYTMHVVEGTAAELFSGNLHPTYTCTLANTTANATGPGNTVLVGCMFIGLGGGTGYSTDTGAVVNVTGPSN